MLIHGLALRNAFAFALLLAAPLAAQRTQPLFENEYVIVGEPHPGIAVEGFPKKMHDHKYNRVMVYMHPGGETLHYQDGSTTVLKWGEREVQWSPASGLHYSVIPPENPSFPGPMIVEIGIKKAGNANKMAASAHDALHADPQDCKLEFENSQVRVIRFMAGPLQSIPMHEHTLNQLVVYMRDANVRVTTADGKAEVTQHKAAETVWSGPSNHKVDNLSDQPFEAVVIEFKD